MDAKQRLPAEQLEGTRGTPDQDAETSAAAGWDPYEIWRTRVLNPRVNSTREQAIAQTHGGPEPTAGNASKPSPKQDAVGSGPIKPPIGPLTPA